MAYDLIGAREAGVTDNQINDTLYKKHNYDIVAARRAGVDESSILGALMSKEGVATPSQEQSAYSKTMGIPERGLFKEAAMMVPRLWGKTQETFGEAGQAWTGAKPGDGSLASRTRESGQMFNEEYAKAPNTLRDHSTIARGMDIVEGLGPVAGQMAAGAIAGSAAGPVGTIAGLGVGALGGFGVFGGSRYTKSKESGIAAGMSEEEAGRKALIPAFVEGAAMTAMGGASSLGKGLLTKAVPALGERVAAGGAVDLLGTGASAFAKRAAQTTIVDTPIMAGTGYLTSKAEQMTGLRPDAKPWEEMVAGGWDSAATALLFGLGHATVARSKVNSMVKGLADESIPIEKRRENMAKIAHVIESRDPNYDKNSAGMFQSPAAEQFLNFANPLVEGGKPLDAKPKNFYNIPTDNPEMWSGTADPVYKFSDANQMYEAADKAGALDHLKADPKTEVDLLQIGHDPLLGDRSGIKVTNGEFPTVEGEVVPNSPLPPFKQIGHDVIDAQYENVLPQIEAPADMRGKTMGEGFMTEPPVTDANSGMIRKDVAVPQNSLGAEFKPGSRTQGELERGTSNVPSPEYNQRLLDAIDIKIAELTKQGDPAEAERLFQARQELEAANRTQSIAPDPQVERPIITAEPTPSPDAQIIPGGGYKQASDKVDAMNGLKQPESVLNAKPEVAPEVPSAVPPESTMQPTRTEQPVAEALAPLKFKVTTKIGGEEHEVEAPDKKMAQKMADYAEAADTVAYYNSEIRSDSKKGVIRGSDYMKDRSRNLNEAQQIVKRSRTEGIEAPADWGMGDVSVEDAMANESSKEGNNLTRLSTAEKSPEEQAKSDEVYRQIGMHFSDVARNKQLSNSLTRAGIKGVTVVRNEAELPEEFQSAQAKILSQDAEGRVEGIYQDGKIVLISNNISSMGRALSVASHELFHRGFSNTLGSKMDFYVDQVYRANKDAIDQLVAEQKIDKDPVHTGADGKLNEKSVIAEGVDEFIAKKSEGMERVPAVRMYIARAREILRGMGFNVALSDNDVRSIIQGSVQKGVEGGATGDARLAFPGKITQTDAGYAIERTDGKDGMAMYPTEELAQQQLSQRDKLWDAGARFSQKIEPTIKASTKEEETLDKGGIPLYHGSGHDIPHGSDLGFNSPKYIGTGEGGDAIGSGPNLSNVKEISLVYSKLYGGEEGRFVPKLGREVAATFLYTTELDPSGVTNPSLLRIDKTLPAQTDRVRRALLAADITLSGKTGAEMYEALKAKLGWEAANALLYKQGIIGIQVPTNWASGDKFLTKQSEEKGEFNYVAFRDSDVRFTSQQTYIYVAGKAMAAALGVKKPSNPSGDLHPIELTRFMGGNVSIESQPGLNSGFMSGLHEAAPEVKAEYHRRMSNITNMGDILLAKEIGILQYADDSVDGVGKYVNSEGKVENNPGTQMVVRNELGPDNRLTPQHKAQMDVYVSLKGLIGQQEAMGYHVPIYDADPAVHNGTELKMDKQISDADFGRLVDGLNEQFGEDAWKVVPVPTKDGVRILLVDGTLDESVRSAIFDAVDKTIGKSIVGHREFFHDGNYIEQGQPGQFGEGYYDVVKRELYEGDTSGARRSDIQRRADSVYQSAYQERRQFAEEQGWVKSDASDAERSAYIGWGPEEFHRKLNDTLFPSAEDKAFHKLVEMVREKAEVLDLGEFHPEDAVRNLYDENKTPDFRLADMGLSKPELKRAQDLLDTIKGEPVAEARLSIAPKERDVTLEDGWGKTLIKFDLTGKGKEISMPAKAALELMDRKSERYNKLSDCLG